MMVALLERALALLPAFDVLGVLALRSAALLALGWLAALLLKRAVPSARQALWTAVLVGLLALPVLTATLPAWRVLPSAFARGSESPPPVASEAQGSLPTPSAALQPTVRKIDAGSGLRLDWAQWAVLVWAGGAVAGGLIFALALSRLRQVRRTAQPASPELRCEVAGVARAFGVRRPVRALVSPRVASPATWGLWRPVIVLPPAAAGWNGERRRMVLAHEMAHIARGDWGWRLVAQVGCVVYWFNPLAWIAAGRLRFEQELACDLAVVERGARPSAYADHLLNIARAGAAGRSLPLVALDMARRSQMEGRLMSILTDRPARRLRRGLLLPALSIAAALPVVAAIQPQEPTAPEAPETKPQPAARSVPQPAPRASLAVTPVVAPSPVAAPSASPLVSVAPTPVLAPSAATSPVLAPTAPRPMGSVSAVLAPAAPATPIEAALAESVTPDTLAPQDRARATELEARIAAKAEEIEALMEPIHLEIERAMAEGMGQMLEEMEHLELEMRPLHEEMSRIGEEMSQRMMETMPDQLEIEEMAQRAAAVALEISRRALDEDESTAELEPLRQELEVLQNELRERHRPLADMEEAMAPFREEMEALRQRMEPQRERMEAMRSQFEPRREEMERMREEHMAGIRERFDALRSELEVLSRELRETYEPGDQP